MQTKFFHLLLLVLISIFPCGCSKSGPPDMEKIEKRGKLIVGVVGYDIPPFFAVNSEGYLEGSDIQIAKDIAKNLGVRVSFNRKARTHDDLIKLVASHEVDVAISELSDTLPRAKIVSFTNPYLTMNQALILNKKFTSTLPKEKSLLEAINSQNISLGILENSAYVRFGKKLFPNANKIYYATWDEAQSGLLREEVVAVLVDEVILERFSKLFPESVPLVDLMVIPNSKDEICMAVPWDSTHLLYWLNLFIDRTNLHQTPAKIIQSEIELLEKKSSK